LETPRASALPNGESLLLKVNAMVVPSTSNAVPDPTARGLG
jgi:hypothetical protein